MSNTSQHIWSFLLLNKTKKNKNLIFSYVMSLFCLLLLPFSTYSFASTAQDFILPEQVTELKLSSIGQGTFKKFGFKVFYAKLWIQTKQTSSSTDTNPNPNPNPPYALQLKYARNIKAKRIVNASIKEMRAQKVPKNRLSQWRTELTNIIPTVKKGDVITGVNLGNKSEFYLNKRLIGEVKNSDFGNDFFGIWLKANTSEPKLRKQLLAIP